jgi:hypothetical protein
MKHYLLSAISVALIVCESTAQTENSAFTLTGHGVATPFATDYQCLGINPANLDLTPRYQDKRFTLGLLELGASFYSEALTKPELRQNLLGEEIRDFTQEDQILYAAEFANSDNSGDLDVMTFGFSAQTNKLGSFAVRLGERMDYYSSLGPQASELLWLGYTAPYFEQLILENGDTIANSTNLDQATLDQVVKGITALENASNVSDLIKGTKFRFSWVREVNVGWGKRLLSGETWQLHGGVGVKFLIGQGILDVDASGASANVFSALSPVFGIEYDDIEEKSPSQLPESASPLSPVGFGVGFDLGTTLVWKDRYYFSAAVTDIGSMTWDGNVYELNDFKLTDSENSGLESVSFLEQVSQISGSDGLLDWKGTESRKTTLPMTGRFGFGAAFEKIRAGVDIVAPLNDEVGSIQRTSIAVGGEFTPVPWVHLSAGFMQGGNYDVKIPAGISFTIGKGTYECGVASRDLITFFTKNQPTVSLTTGFLRFRF